MTANTHKELVERLRKAADAYCDAFANHDPAMLITPRLHREAMSALNSLSEEKERLEKELAAARLALNTDDLIPLATKCVIAEHRAQTAEAALSQAQAAAEGRTVTHVIAFGGEGADVLLCRGDDDFEDQFFTAITGDEQWTDDGYTKEIAMWRKLLADEDEWSLDEERRKFKFYAEIGEISHVNVYRVYSRTLTQ